MSSSLFSPQAATELEQIAARIAKDNPQGAEAFLQAALLAARRLGARPALGGTRPYLPSRYRLWPLTRYRYLLVYEMTDTSVRILRVVHMKRDLPRLLSGSPHK